MSDRAAFLRAIIAAPDDDLPRLIFADWLQENGEPERGEFIRVQCELHRLEADFQKKVDALPRPAGMRIHGVMIDPHLLKLRKREEKLIYGPDGKSWHEWVRELGGFSFSLNYPEPVTSSAPSAKFSRGFVDSITCSWSDWRQNADAIRAVTPLKVVRLTTWPELRGRIEQGSQLHNRVIIPLDQDYSGITFELPQPTVTIPPEFLMHDYFRQPLPTNPLVRSR